MFLGLEERIGCDQILVIEISDFVACVDVSCIQSMRYTGHHSHGVINKDPIGYFRH
mgnify:CR=1 FL=1